MMSAGNISTIPDGVPRALSQTIDSISPSGPNKLFAWLFDQAPLILGSALGMFASNIFLYACRIGRLSALWRVSLHALSSLRSSIRLIATVVWTCQLARHVYLLALCALCQAIILPCLVGSECLRWAGLAWFGTLRILYTTLRILSMVVFDALVVDTGLNRAFVFALGTVTSFLSWVWDWSTDLHDAAIDFVCGPQSTLLRCHSRRADASKASPRRSALRSPTKATETITRLRLDPGPSGTKRGPTIASSVVTYEVDIAHRDEVARKRTSVCTTLRLPLALTDQLNCRAIDITSSPREVDALGLSETNNVRTWCKIDVPSGRNPRGGNLESTEASPGKETVAGRPTNARGKGGIEERPEGKDESRGNETSSVPSDNTQNVPTPVNAPQLRLPVTSPAFWCPPLAGADGEKLEAADHHKTVWSTGVCFHDASDDGL